MEVSTVSTIHSGYWSEYDFCYNVPVIWSTTSELSITMCRYQWYRWKSRLYKHSGSGIKTAAASSKRSVLMGVESVPSRPVLNMRHSGNGAKAVLVQSEGRRYRGVESVLRRLIPMTRPALDIQITRSDGTEQSTSVPRGAESVTRGLVLM